MSPTDVYEEYCHLGRNGLVEVHQRFGRTYCLRLQSLKRTFDHKGGANTQDKKSKDVEVHRVV
jgi:hypothetical protein